MNLFKKEYFVSYTYYGNNSKTEGYITFSIWVFQSINAIEIENIVRDFIINNDNENPEIITIKSFNKI